MIHKDLFREVLLSPAYDVNGGRLRQWFRNREHGRQAHGSPEATRPQRLDRVDNRTDESTRDRGSPAFCILQDDGASVLGDGLHMSIRGSRQSGSR